MTRSPLPLLCLILTACGGRADVRDLEPDVPAHRAPTTSGFEVATSPLAVRSPVVAVASGRRYLAAIIEPEGTPAFIERGRVIAFPGLDRAEGAMELAMVAGPRGMLHAAWTTWDGALYYGRVQLEASRSTAIERLQGSGASSPSLAVSEEGEVFVAFVQGPASREPRRHLAAYRGWVEGGFEGPERIMPECCDTYTDEAWSVHIGGVHYEGGLVHLSYTWRGNRAFTDYVREGRGWYLAERIEDVAMSGHAALLLDGAERGLVTVNEARTELRWHPLSGRAPTRVLYEGEGLSNAHAEIDDEGVLQVVLHRLDERVAVLEHLSLATPRREVEIARGEPGEALWLTPRVGGMALSPDGPVVPFQRSLGRVPPRLEVAAPARGE